MSHALRSLPTLSLLLLGHAASAQDFVLSTPGTATWETVATAGGSQTIFTIHDNSVFDWDHLVLGSGSELIFNFVGGDTVTNYLNGGATHLIAGDVVANGNLGFFSPNADLIVSGSITAESVTLSTLDVDAAAFAGGGAFSLVGGSGAALWIRGRIDATAGDVLLASEHVETQAGARIHATGMVMMAGGADVDVMPDEDRRLRQNSLTGVIVNNGQIRASRIEISAGLDVTNNGLLGEGDAKVFIEVTESGRISNQSEGFIANDVIFEGASATGGDGIGPGEGDLLNPIADASLPIPEVKNIKGEAMSKPRRITYSAPMSASADAIRDRRQKDTRTAKVERKPALASRTSFFGNIMRGAARGSEAPAKN